MNQKDNSNFMAEMKAEEEVYEKIIPVYDKILAKQGCNFKADHVNRIIKHNKESLSVCLPYSFGLDVLISFMCPLGEETPEKVIESLQDFIKKRDRLIQRGYCGEFKPLEGPESDYDSGIEYVYKIPIASEPDLVKIIKDFNDLG